MKLCLVTLLALGILLCEVKDATSDRLQRLQQRLKLVEELLDKQRVEMTHQQETFLTRSQLIEQMLRDRAEDGSEQQALRREIRSALQQLDRAVGADTHPSSSAEAKPLAPDVPAQHDRASSRSDDLGPLEAIVLRLDQTVTQLTAQTQALSSKSDEMARDIHTASASTFVRWGHALCPDHSDLVYTGWAGGSYFTHTGAATNYLCLSTKPSFGDHVLPSGVAYLYGAEYETYDIHMNWDPVCAVCRARLSTTVMIPDTDRCQDGWTRQYSGYLMAGVHDHPAGSQYVCVDGDMQGRSGSGQDSNGKLFYFVVTQCGSLPCPPYVQNKVVSCVVCSK